MRLDLDCEECLRFTPANFEAMKVLMISGALSVSDGTVETLKGKTIRLSDFSSGQWQLLSSLLFSATVVENNSLILIDEPENSLHPAWQQQYLPLIRSTISCATGVHVVVATHSPLVAASLDPEEAEVISLKVGQGGQLRARKLKADPFGWTADAILEEVFGLHSARSVDFTKRMDRALSLMARGDRRNAQLIKLIKSLSKIRETLPEDDVAREIISSMATLVLGAETNG
jgi:predicted ATP-binding protein involved in virulence